LVRDYLSAPSESLSQLSYDEYTNPKLSVGSWDGDGEDWLPSSYAKAKKMKSLTLLTHAIPGCGVL